LESGGQLERFQIFIRPKEKVSNLEVTFYDLNEILQSKQAAVDSISLKTFKIAIQ